MNCSGSWRSASDSAERVLSANGCSSSGVDARKSTGLCSLPATYSVSHCSKSRISVGVDITPYLTSYTSQQRRGSPYKVTKLDHGDVPQARAELVCHPRYWPCPQHACVQGVVIWMLSHIRSVEGSRAGCGDDKVGQGWWLGLENHVKTHAWSCVRLSHDTRSIR